MENEYTKPNRFSRRMSENETVVIVLIGALAFSLRAVLVYLQWNEPVMGFSFFGADSKGYHELAQNLLAGNGFSLNGSPTAFRTPVYPVFLALNYAVFGENFVALGIVQSILGALACVFAYLSAKAIFGMRAGVIAGLAVAVSPDLIIWSSGYILTEPLYIFLLGALVYTSIKVLENAKVKSGSDMILAISTGVLYSLAALTRPAFLYFGAAAIVWLGVVLGRKKGIALAIAFIVPIAAWGFRNYLVFGEPVITTTGGGYVLYEYHNPKTSSENGGYDPDDHHPPPPAGTNEIEQDRFYKNEAVKFIVNNPGRELMLTANRFWNVWRPALAEASARNFVITSVSYLPIVFLAVPAIFVFGFRDRRLRFLAFLLAYFFLFHLFVAGEMRFRYPLLPVFTIYAAAAADRILKKKFRNSF